MGWNSWNWFVKDNINEQIVRQTIDLMVSEGYKEADDSDLLRHDFILKLCLERLPDEKALSSQPTISRLACIIHTE